MSDSHVGNAPFARSGQESPANACHFSMREAP
jgi:hypothetical protein